MVISEFKIGYDNSLYTFKIYKENYYRMNDIHINRQLNLDPFVSTTGIYNLHKNILQKFQITKIKIGKDRNSHITERVN